MKKLLTRTNSTILGGTVNKIKTKLDAFQSYDTQFNPIRVEYNNWSERYNTAQSFVMDLSKTEALDFKRDRLVSAINYCLKMYLDHPDQQKAEAAAILSHELRHYSAEINKLSIDKQSLEIKKVKEILSKPSLASSINSLTELSTLTDALFNVEDELLEARVNYEDEKAERTQQENASDLRKPLIAFINDSLLSYVYAMATVNPDSYQVLASQLLEIVKDNNTSARRNTEKDSILENDNGVK